MSHTFPGSLSAPGDARRFCTLELSGVIGDWPGARGAISTAQLIASELVTNAVNAGSDEVDVTLQLAGDRLRIAVGDNAPELPQMLPAELSDDHGRGLPIVDALSLSWGYERQGASKQVWAEFVIADSATPRSARSPGAARGHG